MYGRHSYSAARMMGLAKQTGAKPEEISAVAWAIMAYLLMHPELWDIPGIMLYLQTTILPDKEFLRLPAEHLYAFFNNNDETRALFYQISENKRAHVLVHTYISMSNRF